jgi:beta-lactamase class A
MARGPIAVLLALAGCGAAARGAGETPGLEATLDRLRAEAAWRSPGTVVALAAADLSTGARASAGGDVLFVSASSAKVWWVAAALHGAGLAAVEPYADAIFVRSDNAATGRAIDLVGPDRVNEYLWYVVGMRSSALTRWNYEGKRESTNSPRRMGTDNYTTASDALLFLERLHRGEILDPARTAALIGWMKRAPRSGLGGWLSARLPPAVAVAHKAGWLDPGCCSDDAVYNTLNEVGLVSLPDRRTYAVVILTHAGRDYWGKQAPYVEYVSCEIYRAVAGDRAHDCARPRDPQKLDPSARVPGEAGSELTAVWSTKFESSPSRSRTSD